MLPRQSLLEGSPHAEALGPVLDAAERALRTWEPQWTGFLEAAVREDAEQRLQSLSELSVGSEGGHAGAERRCLLLQRAEAPLAAAAVPPPLAGLEIAGNFLFDPATTAEFRQSLLAAGAEPGEVGDLWLRGDRGAQAIVTTQLAHRLEGKPGLVRSVEVNHETRPLQELQLPAGRHPRPIASVEASLRLDAVASAGFGVSRSRMAALIRQGAVRINWQPMLSPSRELAPGDRVQLEGRGELEIQSVQETKRGRLRIEMIRS